MILIKDDYGVSGWWNVYFNRFWFIEMNELRRSKLERLSL